MLKLLPLFYYYSSLFSIINMLSIEQLANMLILYARSTDTFLFSRIKVRTYISEMPISSANSSWV